MNLNIILKFMFLVLAASDIKSENKTIHIEIQSIQKALAVEILNSTINTTKNTVVAILPLHFSFCKLATIATGKAKEELLKALGFTDDKMVKTCYTKFHDIIRRPLQTDLTYVNNIYIDYIDAIDSSFAANSSLLYGAHVNRVSYKYPEAASSFINKEISSATYRRVEDVVDRNDINNQTSIMLITAAHYKPTWEVPFDYSLTKKRRFRFLNNTVTEIPMMAKVANHLIYDGKDYLVLTIRLQNEVSTMTFIQPNFLSLTGVLSKLHAEPNFMKNIRPLMTRKHVNFVVPRIKIKNQIVLNDFLKQSGIKEIFDSKSTGLNAILKEGVNASNIFVSKVKQKLFLELDEFGLTRFGYSDMDFVQKPRYPPSMMEIVLDRPFYFTVNLALSHFDTYEIFNGVYYGPE